MTSATPSARRSLQPTAPAPSCATPPPPPCRPTRRPAATGTQLVEMTLPSTPCASLMAGTWRKTAPGPGTAGQRNASYYRILSPAAARSRNGDHQHCQDAGHQRQHRYALNILTFFASTTGISGPGHRKRGTGVPTGATVHWRHHQHHGRHEAWPAGGVSSGASITFGDSTGDLTISDGSITAGRWSPSTPSPRWPRADL